MDFKSFEEIQNNDIVKKRFAKWLVHQCIRNTKLETYHDKPLTDEVVKILMIDFVEHAYDFLRSISGTQGDILIETLIKEDKLPEWNEPEGSNFRSLFL